MTGYDDRSHLALTVETIGRRVRLSVATVARLSTIAYGFGKGRIWLVFLLDLVGAISEFMVVGIVAIMVRGLEKAGPDGVVNFGAPFPPIDAKLLLVAGSLLIAIGLAVAGLMGYWARHLEASLSIQIEKVLQLRLFGALADVPADAATIDGYGVCDPRLNQMLRNDPRYCGRMLGDIIGGTLPVITLIPSIVVLFILDPWITLILLVTVLLATPFLYHANRRAARATLDFEQQMGDVAIAVRGAHNWILQGSASKREIGELIHQQQHTGDIARSLKTYHHLQILAQSSTLTARVMLAVALGATLLFGGNRALEGTGKWADLISFIMLLRMAFSYLQRTLQSFISVNRFTLMVSRYFSLTDAAEALAARTQDEENSEMPDRVRFSATDGRSVEIPSRPGAAGLVGLFAPPGPLDRALVSGIAAVTEPRTSISILRDAVFVTGKIPQQLDAGFDDLTVRQILLIPEDLGRTEPDVFLQKTGFLEAADWYAENGLDVPAARLPANDSVLFGIQLFAAKTRQAPAIVMSGPLAFKHKAAIDGARARLLALRLAIVVFPPQVSAIDQVLEVGGDAAIALRDGRVILTASREQLTEEREQIAEQLSSFGPESNKDGPIPDDILMT